MSCTASPTRGSSTASVTVIGRSASRVGAGGRLLGQRPSLWRRLASNRRVVVGSTVVFALAAVGLLAPLVSPADPEAQVLIDRLQAPGLRHLLGTDGLGRDMLSRAIYGARVSLSVGLVAMAISITIGSAMGLVAGYVGGRIDNLLMRIVDVFISIPIFFLLIAVLSIYGSSLQLLIIFLGLSAWPGTARLVRSVVLSLRTTEFVTAAQAVGARGTRIMLRHILPNVAPVIIVSATLRVGAVILQESALSYFGLGVQPPTATWGNMVADGRIVLDVAWWVSTIPGVLIVLTGLAFNFAGDGLRDVLDPRRRSSSE